MRARWMDPVTGRFVSEDEEQHGSNWFAYCHDDPANAVDADGNCEGTLSGSLLASTLLAALLATMVALLILQDISDTIALIRDRWDDYEHNRLRVRNRRKAKDAEREWNEGDQPGPRPRPKYTQRPQKPPPGCDPRDPDPGGSGDAAEQ